MSSQVERWSLKSPEDHAAYVAHRREIGYRAMKNGVTFNQAYRHDTQSSPMEWVPSLRAYVRPEFLGMLQRGE